MNGTQNKYFMQRCIQLALKGKGNVAPNPMVGSVIVHNNAIIGEGYHMQFGQAHAEVNAINSVKNKELLPYSTIYVSLEPCSHHGKTPPCCNLLIYHKIPHVVVGMPDPFAMVNGAGIEKLRHAGCKVEVGVLERECRQLNSEFITFHTQKRPYIILKWAQTLDGFIDKVRLPDADQQPNWITNEVCRSLVHKWRTEVQSIMVGTTTALVDNPQLNVRSWSGKPPLRMVIDKNLNLPKNLHLFDTTQNTLILNQGMSVVENNLEFLNVEFGENFIPNLLSELYQRGISSLLVEGGAELLNSFISQNYWDEARVFTGNKLFKEGTAAPKIEGEVLGKESLGDTILTVYTKFNLL